MTQPTRQDIKEHLQQISHMEDVEIAEYLGKLNEDDRAVIFRLLPKQTGVNVFSYLTKDERYQLIEDFTHAENQELIQKMMSDDLVDILEELPAGMVTKLLNMVEPGKRDIINKLLQYPEDSAGSIMGVDFLKVREDMTVKETIEKLRSNPIDDEAYDYIYVVNDHRGFVGVVPVRRLIFARDSSQTIASIMDRSAIYGTTYEDQESIANKFRKYGISAMPIVDREGALVGSIPIEDILEVIDEESEEDFAKMSGIQPSKEDESYRDMTAFQLAKKRFGWLLFLLVSATLTGIVIERYEHLLQSVIVLTAFIPMLMDTGGNTGSQSSTLVIRSLALEEIKPHDLGKVLFKEFQVGLLIGIGLAIANFIRIMVFTSSGLNVAITVSLSLILIVIVGKLIGALLPFIAKRLHLDPAVMAAPLVTTVVDTMALIIYFKFAQIFVL